MHAHTHTNTYIYALICMWECICITLCNFITIRILGCIVSTRLPHATLYSYLLSLSPYLWATTNLFSISIIMLFHKCYTNRLLRHLSFWQWLFSLSMISCRFIQVAVPSSFLFMAHNNSWCKCTTASLISHLVKDMGPFIFWAYYK